MRAYNYATVSIVHDRKLNFLPQSQGTSTRYQFSLPKQGSLEWSASSGL